MIKNRSGWIGAGGLRLSMFVIVVWRCKVWDAVEMSCELRMWGLGFGIVERGLQ